MMREMVVVVTVKLVIHGYQCLKNCLEKTNGADVMQREKSMNGNEALSLQHDKKYKVSI